MWDAVGDDAVLHAFFERLVEVVEDAFADARQGGATICRERCEVILCGGCGGFHAESVCEVAT